MEYANLLTDNLSEFCSAVWDDCDISAASGSPAHKKKVSISHANKGFNQSMQADYLTVYVSEDKYEVLIIVDADTNYGERVIMWKMDCKEMAEMLETE